MKYFQLLFVVLFLFQSNGFSQLSFSFSPVNPIDLGTSPEYNTCANSNALNSLGVINVSGVVSPLNTTTNRLAKIELQLDPSCGGNFRNLWFVLKKMPNGPCFVFYDGSSIPTTSMSATAGIQTINLIDNPTCGADLSVPFFTSAQNLSKTTTGNTGFYKAGCHTCNDGIAPDVTLDNQKTQTDLVSPATLTTRFNNVDPNGEWRIFSLYTSGVTSNAPCFKSLTLSFGNPQAADRTPDGNDCESAIDWTGTPFCATSKNKTGSNLMPGSCAPNTNFTSPTKIGGEICGWNFANNNDVWIKYTAPKGGYICLNVSGLKIDQQSIMVTDANADNDNNACTQLNNLKTCLLTANGGTNDPYWKVVSCPRDLSYNATSGSPYNQQHCFTAEEGKTYYLVVDGTDGVESPFYVSGLRGTSAATLNNDYLKLSGETLFEFNKLTWECCLDIALIDRYELERSNNGIQFYRLFNQIQYALDEPVKHYNDQSPLPSTNFYRLKVSLKDGSVFYSSVVELKGKTRNGISVYPNPVVNELHITAANKIDQINIFNAQGQLIYSDPAVSVQTLKLSTIDWNKGQYLVVVRDVLGNVETMRIVK